MKEPTEPEIDLFGKEWSVFKPDSSDFENPTKTSWEGLDNTDLNTHFVFLVEDLEQGSVYLEQDLVLLKV